jgi:hypothetical protein
MCRNHAWVNVATARAMEVLAEVNGIDRHRVCRVDALPLLDVVTLGVTVEAEELAVVADGR